MKSPDLLLCLESKLSGDNGRKGDSRFLFGKGHHYGINFGLLEALQNPPGNNHISPQKKLPSKIKNILSREASGNYFFDRNDHRHEGTSSPSWGSFLEQNRGTQHTPGPIL
jgi:hypothetical protein